MSETLQIFSILAGSTSFIFMYGRWRSKNPNYRDPLMIKFLGTNLDGWSGLHLFHYMLLGYLYPEQAQLSLGAGIAWEAFEHFLGEHRPSWLGGFGDCQDNINVKKNEKWWYGRWSDLVVNTIGFYTGQFLSHV